MKYILILLAWSTIAYGDSLRNGSWWVTLPYNAKEIYISGVYDGAFSPGILLSNISSEDTDFADKFSTYFDKTYDRYLSNVTEKQIIKGLDEFYTDSKNRKILLQYASALIYMKISGDPEVVIQKINELMRR